MKSPEVSLDNLEEIYDYYDEFTANKLVAHLGYRAFALALSPRIAYDGNAENMLHEEVDRKTGLIIAPNHISLQDPYIVAGAAAKTPLRRSIGNVMAWGKAEIFENNGSRVHFVKRYISDNLGGIPLFRPSSYPDAERKQLLHANTRAYDITAKHLARGGVAAIFAEGTIQRGEDKSKVLPIQSGIARVAHEVLQKGGTPTIAPMAISRGPHGELRHPNVIMGEPYDVSTLSKKEIQEYLQENLQSLVTRASESY